MNPISSSPTSPVFSPFSSQSSPRSTSQINTAPADRVNHPLAAPTASSATQGSRTQKVLRGLKRLWQSLVQPKPLTTTEQLFQQGHKLERHGHYLAAETHYRQALDLAHKQGNHHHFLTYAIRDALVANYLTRAKADCELAETYYPKAQALLEESLRTQERYQAPRSHIAKTNVALGQLCQTAGQPEEAGEYFYKALNYYEEVRHIKDIKRIQNALKQLEELRPFNSTSHLA